MPKQDKPQPTQQQVEAFTWLLDDFNFDMIEAEMQDGAMYGTYGLMYVHTIEDELHQGAYFDTGGKIVGNWF